MMSPDSKADTVLYDTDEMTSPYAHIIHTNYVPSASESHEIKVFLLEPESELRRLETEIARIRAILNGLLSEHDKLKNFVDAHKALMSPIRRLPPEILQKIFVRCLSETRTVVMHRSEAPRLLTEVCVEWRNIAFSTPALWSTLHLTFPDIIGSEETRVHFDVAEAWLARSGVLPLSISVYDQNWTIRRPTVFDLLHPFFHRCRRLRLSIKEPDIDQINGLVFPVLEDITVFDWYFISMSEPTKSYAFLKDISSLKKATLLGLYNLEPAFSLPLAQLEVLHLHCSVLNTAAPGETLEILESCRKLQVVSLSFESTGYELAWFKDRSNGPVRVVTMPLLHSFYILVDDSLLAWMLEHLILPGIRVLGISRRKHGQGNAEITHDHFPAQLESFLARSSHTLEKFVFHPLRIKHATLVACLSLVPDITELDLNGRNSYYRKRQDAVVTLNGAILRSLTRTSDNPEYLCPNLKRLTLKYCSGLFGNEVVDLIRSRRRSVPPGSARLAHANITFDRYSDPAVASHLDAFRNEGLDISVVSPPPETPEPLTPWEEHIEKLDTQWSRHLGSLQ